MCAIGKEHLNELGEQWHNGHRWDIREAQSRSLQLSEASRILASLVKVVPAPAQAHARTFSYEDFLDLQFLKMGDCLAFEGVHAAPSLTLRLIDCRTVVPFL